MAAVAAAKDANEVVNAPVDAGPIDRLELALPLWILGADLVLKVEGGVAPKGWVSACDAAVTVAFGERRTVVTTDTCHFQGQLTIPLAELRWGWNVLRVEVAHAEGRALVLESLTVPSMH